MLSINQSERFQFSGKANTLTILGPLLTKGKVLPLERVNMPLWLMDSESVILRIFARFGDCNLIIRSSSGGEDQDGISGAGMYDSVTNVRGAEQLKHAINQVFDSYSRISETDEVLIQPMAEDVRACGVAMTRDPETGLPYYVVDYTIGNSTNGVTSGTAEVFSFVAFKSATDRKEPSELSGLFGLLAELEQLTERDDLDVEFAITKDGPLLLQVRAMTGNLSCSNIERDLELHATLSTEALRINDLLEEISPLKNDRVALLGLMPDWNPAEMIGVKPRPLAFSLYKELITDINWASARFRFGYRDMRDKKLMFQFCGSPYVCIPYSIESFIPAGLPQSIVESAVAGCCHYLAANQHFHDKIEFAIIPTCFTPSLVEEHGSMPPAFVDLTPEERKMYLDELKHLTEHIMSADGPFFSDLALIPRIEQSMFEFTRADNSSDKLQTFFRALSGAKRVGEVFAGMARAAFVATAILKSLEKLQKVRTGFTDDQIASANTIGRRLSDDFRLLSKGAFLARHGHVRPGTYDIRVPRYDETPDDYFDWSSPLERPSQDNEQQVVDRCTLSAVQKAFDQCDLHISSKQFITFARAAVNARENVKYIYSAFISEALKALAAWGEQNNFSRNDLSFASLNDLGGRGSCVQAGKLAEQIENGRRRWTSTQNVRAPIIICQQSDLLVHKVQPCHPSFISRYSIDATVRNVNSEDQSGCDLEGCIVLIESADPGFDWIFTRRIAGFITAYGGENSHMSIRAREFSIPAAIGVGETRFRTLALAKRINLDCAAHCIQVLA